MRAIEFVAEKWSKKYKRSINCNNPKGFSQKAHCQGRKKTESINEKAVSKKQQQFFGIVRAMQKGDMPKSGEAGDVAKDISKADAKDFAKTKHKGLPTKKKTESVDKAFQRLMREHLEESKINFTMPNFDYEWGEANRYPEYRKLGKEEWIKLAKTGKAVDVDNRMANDIENTEAGEEHRYDYWDGLVKAKRDRFTKALSSGQIELPIIARYSDGYLELVAGNTRLTGMMRELGRAKAWVYDVPDEVADLEESYTREELPQIRNKHLENIDHEIVFLNIDEVVPVQKERVMENFKRQVDRLIEGKYSPVIVDCHNRIVNGHHRYDAVRLLGETTIPVARIPHTLECIIENFADGKKKGKSRPGRVKRAGASCNGSVTALRKRAKNASGEKAKMYHWCANMKSGRKKGK